MINKIIFPIDITNPKPVPFPGSEKLDPMIGWALHAFWYAAILGMIICAGSLVLSYRNGNAESQFKGFGWIFVACIIVSSVGTYVKFFMG